MAWRIPHRTLRPTAPRGLFREGSIRRSALAALALLAAGCQRALPGPEDCVAFAEAWLEVRPGPTQLDADTKFDELVRRCLTTPYDRELVVCVIGRQNIERCRVDYARRVEAQREERSR